jgi:hypothetical protein
MFCPPDGLAYRAGNDDEDGGDIYGKLRVPDAPYVEPE